ncbi:MAG: hypothetical protein HY372_00930 [Candidatus Andersenbacteria bacterium]|nr:hypothetical protein [Candidatus Andersenbacteria bacterium]
MSWFSVLLLLGMAALIPTAYAAKIGAPYVPTYRRALIAAFDFIQLGPGDALVDLGAGDGKVVRLAAQRGASAIGFELSPIMWVIAVLWSLRYPHARVYLRNFYRQSLQQTLMPLSRRSNQRTILFTFLMPQNMERVRRYLASQSVQAARYFLSYMFPLPNTEPVKIIRVPRCGPVYIYDLRPLTKPLAAIKPV